MPLRRLVICGPHPFETMSPSKLIARHGATPVRDLLIGLSDQAPNAVWSSMYVDVFAVVNRHHVRCGYRNFIYVINDMKRDGWQYFFHDWSPTSPKAIATLRTATLRGGLRPVPWH